MSSEEDVQGNGGSKLGFGTPCMFESKFKRGEKSYIWSVSNAIARSELLA